MIFTNRILFSKANKFIEAISLSRLRTHILDCAIGTISACRKYNIDAYRVFKLEIDDLMDRNPKLYSKTQALDILLKNQNILPERTKADIKNLQKAVLM